MNHPDEIRLAAYTPDGQLVARIDPEDVGQLADLLLRAAREQLTIWRETYEIAPTLVNQERIADFGTDERT
jgi:hypothetical protein